MPKKKVDKEPEELVTMTGTKSQFQLVVRALDFYSRILAGQWYELESVMRMNYPIARINYSQIRSVTQIIEGAKCVLFPELTYNSSMGIGSDKLAPDAGQSYELKKWIENYLVRNIKESWCAGDPPLRVSDQEKIKLSDPASNEAMLLKMGNAASSMAFLLGLAGIPVTVCKLCGHAHKEGVEHDCSGQAQDIGQAGVPLCGHESGGREGDSGAACAGDGLCACRRAGGDDDVPVRGRGKVPQADKKRRVAGARKNGLGTAGRRTKGGR